MITGRQIRAARGLLDWTAADLAQKSGLTRETVSRIEVDSVQAREGSLEKILRVFDDNGIEFIGNFGVQWVQHQTKTLMGVEGLRNFFNDVRAVAQNTTEEIVIYGIVEKYLEEKLGDFVDFQRQQMASYKNIKMRCLVEESDFNLGASDYCHYRWQTKEFFSNVPFYIYGDKMAIIVTSGPEDPLILLIQNRTIAQAYRKQFDAMWSIAKEPLASGGSR